MPYNCPVCNNTNYEEIDGNFFCTECQTQSQELIVQETDENINFNFRHEVKASEAGRKSSKKYPKVNLGRPWTIYEAYQIIILAQADALVRQGADEQLKDVVFTIWANYLSMLGVAFCRKEKLVPDIVTKTKYGRHRELHRGTLSNPLNRRKRPFIECHTSPSQANSTSHLRGEQFYADDNPDAADGNIIFLDDGEDDENGAVWSRKARIDMAVGSPEWMKMNKTIAICYIGLMFTNPNILPCDVIRFVYESKVPFLSVTHLLPPDMVLSSNDKSLFETGRFDTKTLIDEINQLLTYLELNKLPSPDLDVIIPRFVRELCLPGELASFAHHLMKKIPFVWVNKIYRYKKQEVLAMGYIVLAVKIAMRLDDSTELRLSRYSQKLQDMIGPKMKLFVWTDWIKFMIQKRANDFDAYRELTKDISKCRLQHLDQLLECYYKNESDKRRHTTKLTINRHQHPVRCFQPEFRNSLQKPLETASDRFESRTNLKQNAVCKSQKVLATKSQEFHHSTMSHIVDISLFKGQVGEISPKIEARLDKLLLRYSLPTTDVLQYSLIKKDENLESHRHESYLCLLSLVSKVVDCSVEELDVFVVHLLSYLIAVSNGTVKHGRVCNQLGHFCASKKPLKNLIPHIEGS